MKSSLKSSNVVLLLLSNEAVVVLLLPLLWRGNDEDDGEDEDDNEEVKPPPNPPGLSLYPIHDAHMNGLSNLANPGDETHDICDSFLQLPHVNISSSLDMLPTRTQEISVLLSPSHHGELLTTDTIHKVLLSPRRR